MAAGSVVGSTKVSGAINQSFGPSGGTYTVPANCYAIISGQRSYVYNGSSNVPLFPGNEWVGPGDSISFAAQGVIKGVLFINAP